MNTYIVIYFGSLFVAVLVTPLVIRLARWIGAVDQPGVRTVHERPIPRIGGVAIFLAAMAMIGVVVFLNNNIGQAFRAVRLQLVALLGAATFIFLVGLVDDLMGLSARWKFLAQLLAAGAVCLAGVQIGGIGIAPGLTIQLGDWGCLLTLLWIVGITNAVNFSDGLDGLAAGVSAIACAVIAILSVHGNDVMMAVFALALLGSLSGFLFFNFNPARIFMGDCGSLFLGFMIAASSVMCVAKSTALVGLALPALALGIPIFDTLFSMLRRFLQRRSLFAPDRSHFHHRLLELGLQQRHAVMAIYLATALATGLGLFMLASQDVSQVLVFGCLLLLILLMFRVVGSVRLSETLTRLQEKCTCTRLERSDRQAFEHLQLRFRQVCDDRQWWQAVCEAAGRMEFAWVALTTTYPDGRTEQEIWRTPDKTLDLSRVMTMTIPTVNGDPTITRRFEIAVCVNGSFEAASRRVTLFGRLLDEHAHPPDPEERTGGPLAADYRPQPT